MKAGMHKMPGGRMMRDSDMPKTPREMKERMKENPFSRAVKGAGARKHNKRGK